MSDEMCGCGAAFVGECFSCECDVCVIPTSTHGIWLNMGDYHICGSCAWHMGLYSGTALVDVRVG